MRITRKKVVPVKKHKRKLCNKKKPIRHYSASASAPISEATDQLPKDLAETGLWTNEDLERFGEEGLRIQTESVLELAREQGIELKAEKKKEKKPLEAEIKKEEDKLEEKKKESLEEKVEVIKEEEPETLDAEEEKLDIEEVAEDKLENKPKKKKSKKKSKKKDVEVIEDDDSVAIIVDRGGLFTRVEGESISPLSESFMRATSPPINQERLKENLSFVGFKEPKLIREDIKSVTPQFTKPKFMIRKDEGPLSEAKGSLSGLGDVGFSRRQRIEGDSKISEKLSQLKETGGIRITAEDIEPTDKVSEKVKELRETGRTRITKEDL